MDRFQGRALSPGLLPTLFQGGKIMKSPITTLAALILIIAALLIIVFQFNDSNYTSILTSLHLSGNVHRCRTLTWKISIPDKGAIIQGAALEPYYVKLLLADGRIWLLNRRKKQILLMDPAKKTAKITFMENQPPDIYEALSNFKNIPHSERVGQRMIGETQAIGYGVPIGHDQATVWFDPQTQLPIRIEFSGMDKCGQTEPAFIWSEIVYDVELDESLFRFDLAGYKVEEVDSEWDWKNIVRLAWWRRIQPYKLKLYQQKYQAGLVWLGLFSKISEENLTEKKFAYIKICPTIVIHNDDNRLS
jgi:hypothetical protein